MLEANGSEQQRTTMNNNDVRIRRRPLTFVGVRWRWLEERIHQACGVLRDFGKCRTFSPSFARQQFAIREVAFLNLF